MRCTAGEKLKVSDASNSGLIEKFKTLVEKSFSGKVIVEVSKDGMVTFHKVPNTELTEFESNAFDILKYDVEGAEEIALFNLVDGNTGGEDVTFDNFFSQEVDIDDIAALGIKQEGGTSLGALVHVATEYIGKAQDEALEKIQVNEDTPSNREDYYNPNHNIGEANESNVQKLQTKSSTQLGIGTKKVIRDKTVVTYVNKVLFFDGENTRYVAVRYTITNNNIDRIEQFELDDSGNIIETTGVVSDPIDTSTDTDLEKK